MNEVWQETTVAQTEEQLNTNTKWGMTSNLALKKQNDKAYKPTKRSAIQFFLSAVADPFHILMLVVSLILMIGGRAVSGIITLAVMLVRSIYSSARNASYENVKLKAQKLRVPHLTVVRDGEEIVLPADSVVDGDVLILKSGDVICFPIKIAENNGLIFLPQNAGEDYEISDDDKEVNVALPGMKVAFGEGRGIVLDSAYTYEEIEQSEQLPEFLKGTSFWLFTAGALFLSLLVSAIAIAKGNDAIDCFASAVGLFLVSCPLGLPNGFKLCSIDGLQKINSSAVLTPLCAKKLREASYIALSEKDVASPKLKLRGVITTYNEFNMDYQYGGQDKAVLKMIEEMACLCTNAFLENGIYEGTLHEKAIIEGASNHGVFKELLITKYPRVFEKQSEEHLTVGVKIKSGVRVISMGSPKEILSMCDSVLADGEVLKITEDINSSMLKKAKELEKAGSYVCGIAFSDNEEDTSHEKTNLCFLGLILVSHQADLGKLSFIKKCKSANLTPLLFTSLPKEKAEVVASFYKKSPYILSGEEIDNLTDRDLKHLLLKTDGYASLSVQQKGRILSMLKENGQAVLYPAEAEEDILFKDKAHICLAPENAPQNLKRASDGTVSFLEQIPELKKATVNLYRNQNNLLGQNLALNLGILLCSLLTSLCLPYGPNELLQYLWIGLFVMPITNLMISKAQDNSKGVNGKSTMYLSIISGVIIGVLAFVISLVSYFSGAEMFAKGMMFWFIIIAILVLGLQSQTTKLLTTDILKNKKGVATALACIILTLIIQLVSPLAESFALAETRGINLLFVILFGIVLIIITDVIKWIQYKINKKEIQNGRKI